MQRVTLKKSTDTLYEIKAPLATFDTIDLDDFDAGHSTYSVNSLKVPSPEKCAPELCGSSEKEVPQEISDPKDVEKGGGIESCHVESLTDEPETPTCTATFKDEFNCIETSKSEDDGRSADDDVKAVDNDSADALKLNCQNDSDVETSDMTESGNITPTEASTGSKEANSSENNASAEEIQIKLKEKGRKHKEKASNVKYQQIDSLSDVSDQEKESPLPTVKKKGEARECNSDSESTDSDSGYIRRGYIPASKLTPIIPAKPADGSKVLNIIGDFVDSADSTPYSSPKPRRPTVPPPLTEEESAIISKRKAYEKRLQRLQVTTNPIERPRSTTPINIYGLEEYINISSPEKSPANLQKLKIKLPLEESSFKGKSPRRCAKLSAHRSSESGEPHVFTFNEDLLFTHTKSAILLEDDISKGYSPKRVLVPPTLSPKVSPCNLPAKSVEIQNSAKYMYSPWENSPDNKQLVNTNDSSTADTENWAIFDNSKDKSFNEPSNKNNTKFSNDNIEELSSNIDNFNINEEILTVHIDGIGDSRTCDISCEEVEVNTTEQSGNSNSNVECNKDTVNNENVLNYDQFLQANNIVEDTDEDLGTPL